MQNVQSALTVHLLDYYMGAIVDRLSWLYSQEMDCALNPHIRQ